MAAGWVKSLQCKSRAFEDVYHPNPKQLLLQTASCRNSYQNLKDVVGKNTANPHSNKPPKPKSNPKPSKKPDPNPPSIPKHPPNKRRHHPSFHRRSDSTKPKPDPDSSPANDRVRRTLSAPIKAAAAALVTEPYFPALSELPAGHPSRNVVEIIFHTRWGPRGFSGRVEVVFRVQTAARTAARFEEYRDLVRARAAGGGNGGARCSADGNEVMRFRCLGPTAAGAIDVGGECGGGKGSVCTYSGSGAAHESAGGGRGRRAMLVCRVIAGRVAEQGGGSPEFDSVSGDGGELLVFDSRAVLPCFLVIYKL